MPTVLAGIVLYNSDFDRLLQCLENLHNQVEATIVLDNSPKKYSKQQIEMITAFNNCEYIFTNENLGMSEGMNRIIEKAKKKGYKWVLTMNADSIVPNNLISDYKPFFYNEKVGMICPQVIDKRRKYMKLNPLEGYEKVDMCITSAACTRISAWENVGKFDGNLFVDLLDNDISKRMILNGWDIIKVNTVVLDQEFGDIRSQSPRVESFWLKVGEILHNNNFSKFSYKKTVYPIRVYYTCRNILYLNKKFSYYGGIGYEYNYNCKSFLGFLICFVLPSILRADERVKVIKAVMYGFRDGKRLAVMTKPWKANF